LKYNFIKFIPIDGRFVVNVIQDESDRKYVKTKPNPIGFYHAPEFMSVENAIESLKKTMIDRHIKEIEKLKKSIEQLERIEIK
jgi:hypothetical protein